VRASALSLFILEESLNLLPLEGGFVIFPNPSTARRVPIFTSHFLVIGVPSIAARERRTA